MTCAICPTATEPCNRCPVCLFNEIRPPTAAQIAHKLQGTCMSLSECLEQHDAEQLESDSAFCAELDSLVFCCERCSWWHEQSEMADDINGDWICEDCSNE